MKLFSHVFYDMLFLLQLTSGFTMSNYAYINNHCFEFGDCIDKGQDDNTFWISQLDAYLRQSASHLTSALKTVERKIYQPPRDDGNLTIFDGTPQLMCMPTQELSRNNAFMRKMHSAYRLSELARKCKTMTMDIVGQVLARLHVISEALDARNRRINDRAPTDALYLHQTNSTSKEDSL